MQEDKKTTKAGKELHKAAADPTQRDAGLHKRPLREGLRGGRPEEVLLENFECTNDSILLWHLPIFRAIPGRIQVPNLRGQDDRGGPENFRREGPSVSPQRCPENGSGDENGKFAVVTSDEEKPVTLINMIIWLFCYVYCWVVCLYIQ